MATLLTTLSGDCLEKLALLVWCFRKQHVQVGLCRLQLAQSCLPDCPVQGKGFLFYMLGTMLEMPPGMSSLKMLSE